MLDGFAEQMAVFRSWLYQALNSGLCCLQGVKDLEHWVSRHAAALELTAAGENLTNFDKLLKVSCLPGRSPHIPPVQYCHSCKLWWLCWLCAGDGRSVSDTLQAQRD